MGKTVTHAAPVEYSAVLTSIDESQYETQLAAKLQRLEELFSDLPHPALKVHRSPASHFRMRTEFNVWHEGTALHFRMFDKHPESGDRVAVCLEQFPVASELCNKLMTILLRELPKDNELRAKLFQVNLHSTLSGQAMVTLLYHRKLGGAWEEAARKLRAVLVEEAAPVLHVIGRSKGQKLCLDADEVEEELELDGRRLRYVQVEASFSQPNAAIAAQMLGWAHGVAAGSEGRDLLELYCGNGNFTAALAPRFRKVVATELSKASVAAARRNFALNGVDNVFVARMRSEEFTEAWHSGKRMERLKGLDLRACDFQTLLVDPPRAGLDPGTLDLTKEFDNIIYISCNPETLHSNLQKVSDTFEIKEFAVFDQFPWTGHIESGVYLQRRPGVPKPDKTATNGAAAASSPQASPTHRGLKRKGEPLGQA